MVKISVILPVFNVEGYIERCIESLQVQTLDELEFIFVDDCSTDGSMAPVEAWAAKDGRVRILTNDENLGAGPSRNRGIKAARGDYLSFIDPDDHISSDYFQLLYAAAKCNGGHDIAKGLHVRVDDNGNESRSQGKIKNKSILDTATNKALYRRFTYEHWSAIYRRALFENEKIRYGESRKSQDTTFLLRMCYFTEDIVVEPRAEYFYRTKRKGSAINQDTPTRFDYELDGLEEKVAFLREMGLDDQALLYLALKATVHLEGYRDAARFGTELHASYEHFLSRLMSIVESIPGKETILEAAPIVASPYNNVALTRSDLRSPNEGLVRVSVILPVFNVENYIGRCIESLRAQLLDGLEFIFVDDCSTDGSMEEVEAWAAEDERVRILRNDENIGAGPSRNRGIEAARGDYLSFVDPDDYISPCFYELLYAAAMAGGGYDIAKGSCKKVDAFGAAIAPTSQLNATIAKHQEEGRPLFVSFTHEHWTAIYHKSVFADNSVRYGTSCYDQDTTFQLAYTLQTNSIVLEKNAIYYYVKRPRSASESVALGRFMEELDALAEKAMLLEGRRSDRHARAYLKTKFGVAFGRFCTFQLDYPSLAYMTSEYAAKLKSIVEGSPALRFLQSESLEYRAVTEYGALLPFVASLPEAQKFEGALTWLDFIRDYNITEAEYIDACADAIVVAIQQPAKTQDRGFRDTYSQLTKELETLPVKQRSAIWIKVHRRLATKHNAKRLLRKLRTRMGRD